MAFRAIIRLRIDIRFVVAKVNKTIGIFNNSEK